MKINRKLSIGTMLILFAIGFISLYLHFKIILKEGTDQLQLIGNAVGPVIEASLTHSMRIRDAEILNTTFANLRATDSISRILLLNKEGLVKAGTDPSSLNRRIDLDMNVFAGEGKTGRARGRVEGERFRWVQAVQNKAECHQCHNASHPYNGAIVVDFSEELLKKQVARQIAGEALLFFMSFLVVALAMSWLSGKVVIRPLRGVYDALKKFSAGDASVRIQISGRDEFAELGAGFNRMVEDISAAQAELRAHADELMALAVSSNVITAISRTENIYAAACNITVKELGIRMAWIGAVTGENNQIAPIAFSGAEDGYLEAIQQADHDLRDRMGPARRAAETMHPQVVNELKEESQGAPWKQEALKRGYRSLMAVPLITSETGLPTVLTVISAEAGYFTRKRIRKFMIFANQAAAAIENRQLLDDIEQRNREIADQLEIISRSQQEWQKTFDSITDLVSIHDTEYRIIKSNKAFREQCGLVQAGISGEKCFESFHGACGPVDYCPHKTTVDTGRPAIQEIHDPKSNKLFRVSTYPYHASDGKFLGSVHIARDITEEKDKELRLIMTERLASLGQMASGVAHEINNPLASIAGCTEALRNRVRSNRCEKNTCEEYFTIILDEIRRCKSITTSMLSFVRTSSYEKKGIVLHELIDKTIEMIGFQGRLSDVEIVKNYAEQMLAFSVNEGELRQVMLIILTNALDAMEDRGRLEIATMVRGTSAVIKVMDSGGGIPEQDLKKIFDPFFTTKSPKGGTGLGLSIAHKIIVNHGGAIHASSRGKRGSDFIIDLPLSPV